MFIRSVIVGSLVTIVLVVIIAVTRLFKTNEDPPKEEMVSIQQYLPQTPEPPLEELEELKKEDDSEEITDLKIPELDLLNAPHLDSPALPTSTSKFLPDLAQNTPLLERAPAPLPQNKITSIKSGKKSTSTQARPRIKETKPPVVKEFYQVGELDARPRETRQGKFTWPRGARGNVGTVSLKIEINTSGKVRVISVLSASDPKLISPAKRLARMSRYTAPRRNGKAVKARFTKNYKLIKPR